MFFAIYCQMQQVPKMVKNNANLDAIVPLNCLF